MRSSGVDESSREVIVWRSWLDLNQDKRSVGRVAVARSSNSSTSLLPKRNSRMTSASGVAVGLFARTSTVDEWSTSPPMLASHVDP